MSEEIPDKKSEQPSVVMELQVTLFDDGGLTIGGMTPTMKDVCIANIILDKAKDAVKSIKIKTYK